MQWRHLAFGLAAATLTTLFCLGGCSSSSGDVPVLENDGGFGKDGKGNGNGNDTICLLNNCDTDRECADCTGDRTTCLQKEHRCIACGPDSGGKSCTPGQNCTKYGDCVPNGTVCPVDGAGTPTVTCKSNLDCAACDPKHKSCDTGSGKCVGCVASDVTNCQSTDVCKSNTCLPACPATCNVDGDCSSCGAPGKEAHACNRHVCSVCSPTKGCNGSESCDPDHGTCKKSCGLPGRPSACNGDPDCAGCKGTTKCDLPIGGGPGTCSAPVAGCSDLGKGIFVLPDPFSRVTNLCSNDGDCSGVSADFNIGGALRDITGLSLIKDANISYAMHACASVQILGKSCGVCVPCKTDPDCADIDIGKVAGDMFGPIGSIAATLLLDKAFGPNDHKVHMYCENVAGDYGVCVPCPNMLARCAVGGDVPPSGTCDHDVCTTGGPLGVQCEACTAAVCAKDSFCCANTWDFQCKREVDDYCTTKTCAAPDTCQYKKAGWYCSTLKGFSSYQCDDNQQILGGYQCGNNEYCHKVGTGVKDTAMMCPGSGCPDAGANVPQCFTTPP